MKDNKESWSDSEHTQSLRNVQSKAFEGQIKVSLSN